MQLSDIKITSLSVTGNTDGSENLNIGVAYGEGDNEEFFSRSITTKGTLTLQHLEDAIERVAETAGVK